MHISAPDVACLRTSSSAPSIGAQVPTFSLRTIVLIGVAAAALFVVGATSLARFASNHWPSAWSSASLFAVKPAMTGTIITKADSEAIQPEPMVQVAEHETSKMPGTPPLMSKQVLTSLAQPAQRAVSAAVPMAAKPMGHVTLAVSPWGEVYVDGRKRGISPPLAELKLAPGKHTIEIRNTTFAPYADTVNLESNAYVRIKHRFR